MRKLKFTDYFHDEEIRSEIYSVESIDKVEEFGLLGYVNDKPSEVGIQHRIARIVERSILDYLIKTRGEKAVWEYLKSLDYDGLYDGDYTEPGIERDLPTGRMNQRASKELPDVMQAIRELPIKEAIVQLKILSLKPWVTPGFSRRFSRACTWSFKESFGYSNMELALNDDRRGVRFQLPESPEELLLLGAQEGSLVSLFAYQDELSSQVVLMFDSSRHTYLGYIELDRATHGILSVAFSDQVKQGMLADKSTTCKYGFAIAEWARGNGLPGLVFRRQSFWVDSIRIEFESDLANNSLIACGYDPELNRDIPEGLWDE